MNLPSFARLLGSLSMHAKEVLLLGSGEGHAGNVGADERRSCWGPVRVMRGM